MDFSALEQLVKSRRSIRKWKEQSVPDELLIKAIDLAVWAPNGGNYQGWHFVVVKNKSLIGTMGDAVQSVVDNIATWPEASAFKDDMERSRRNASFFRNAPVCIGVFHRKYVSSADKVLLAREAVDQEARRILAYRRTAPTAIQSAAAAATTLLLALQQEELGAVWLGAPLLAKDKLETLMHAPEDMSLVCLIAVGYPDEAPQQQRKPVSEVLKFIH